MDHPFQLSELHLTFVELSATFHQQARQRVGLV